MMSSTNKTIQKIDERLGLRPVTDEDKEKIFEWTQMPFLIKFSTSGRKVTWEEHCQWFDKVIRQESVKIFIVTYNYVGIGQVRFEHLRDNRYRTTIYLIEEYTGRGLGAASLKCAMDIMVENTGDVEFIAFIKNDNHASHSLFVKAGFMESQDHEHVPSNHTMYLYRAKGNKQP